MSECKHRRDPLSHEDGRDYLAWHDDAAQRKAQGRDRQKFCKVCRRYLWVDLWDGEEVE